LHADSWMSSPASWQHTFPCSGGTGKPPAPLRNCDGSSEFPSSSILQQHGCWLGCWYNYSRAWACFGRAEKDKGMARGLSPRFHFIILDINFTTQKRTILSSIILFVLRLSHFAFYFSSFFSYSLYCCIYWFYFTI